MAKFQRALDSIACENQKPAMVKGSLKGERLPGGEQGPMVMLSVSVSAQELRSLDKEEEGSECLSNSSSPREAMEDCMRGLESETNSPKASTSYSSNQSQNGRSPWRGFFRLLKQRSMRRLSTIPPVPLPRLTKRNKSSRENSTSSKQIPVIDPESLCFKPSWKNFTLTELEKATNYFSSENMIGTGGYAEVYKGQLQDGQLVAVKRLTRESTEETTNDFLMELGIMVHINHPNAAKLIGFGVEGGMHLVLQLSLHGSLACLLSGSKEELNWGVRHRIAIGTAEGLHYLHEGGQRRIIHRDIKASNILLTDDFEPQICDYGLAKWLPDQWTHHNVSKFEGTFGYLAPEYLLHGIVDEKTDVFAFGVLLLELITGRPAIDSSQKSLVMWAKPLLEKNDIKQLVDPSLGDAYNRDEMNHVTLAVSKCIEHSSLLRPRMSQVIQILKGEGKLKSLKSSHTFALHRTYSEELLDADEYNSTRYLHELRRHRQVALESCNS